MGKNDFFLFFYIKMPEEIYMRAEGNCKEMVTNSNSPWPTAMG